MIVLFLSDLDMVMFREKWTTDIFSQLLPAGIARKPH